MQDHGAPTKKPTMLLTNSASICKLHNAQVVPDGKSKRPKRSRPKKQPGRSAREKAKMRKGGSLCRRYVDRAGRQRFAGTKKLKESQILGLDSFTTRNLLGQPSIITGLHVDFSPSCWGPTSVNPNSRLLS